MKAKDIKTLKDAHRAIRWMAREYSMYFNYGRTWDGDHYAQFSRLKFEPFPDTAGATPPPSRNFIEAVRKAMRVEGM